jgi:hypothetical protein
MEYLLWNDRIAANFFSPVNEGRRVYLFVTRALIGELGADHKADLPDLIEALQRGPGWAVSGNVCDNAVVAFSGWRRRHLTYPPYLAYLAFFSLAAGIEGDFATHAYYPRLRSLLSESPVAGTYPGFAKMRALWDDLESWTQQDLRGRLGIFQADVNSRFVHVGLPISQTILSEAERLALPAMFASGGLDPEARPSDEVIGRLLLRTDGALRVRTRNILAARSSHEEEFEALIEAVVQELAGWDGEVPAAPNGPQGSSIYGTARLWCEELDSVAGRAQMRLVCRTSHDYPEEGLALDIAGRPGVYRCKEFEKGWSTPLQSAAGDPLDASTLDWREGVRLRETTRNWRFFLAPSAVRLFMSAESDGMSGLLEVQGLLPETAFLVISRREHRSLLENWGIKSCERFENITVRSGLPPDWLVYLGNGARSDELIASVFPVLALPHTARISFQGGLSAAPSSYFPFALPTVTVTGAAPTAELFCNSRSLGKCSMAAFQVPEQLHSDVRLEFEVRQGQQSLSRRSIYLESGLRWPRETAIAWSAPDGRVTNVQIDRSAAGAFVFSPDAIPSFTDWVTLDRVGSQLSSHAPIITEPAIDPSPPSDAPPTVTFTSEAEVRRLIALWKSGIEHGSAAEGESLTVLSGGTSLTEGYRHYLIASSGAQHKRNWSRAIRELSDASASPDPIVSAIACALLQLAFYWSGRQDDVLDLARKRLPPGFAKLQSFMQLLAGSQEGELSLDGVGISDISPLDADKELEHRLFGSAQGGSGTSRE